MLISTQRVQTAHFKHISLKKLFVSVTFLVLFWTKNLKFFYFILEKSVFSESFTKRDWDHGLLLHEAGPESGGGGGGARGGGEIDEGVVSGTEEE